MLFVAALVLRPSTPAEEFIDECARAVRLVDEGTLEYFVKASDSAPVNMQVIRRGGEEHWRYLSEDKLYFEMMSTAGAATMVDHEERTVTRFVFPKLKKKVAPESPSPLELGRVDFRLPSPEGFVLRTNPPLAEATLAFEGETETMEAIARKDDGSTVDVELVRDRKTKLPINLAVYAGGYRVKVRFAFSKRKVTDEEMALTPESFKGFRELQPPVAPSGNL